MLTGLGSRIPDRRLESHQSGGALTCLSVKELAPRQSPCAEHLGMSLKYRPPNAAAVTGHSARGSSKVIPAAACSCPSSHPVLPVLPPVAPLRVPPLYTQSPNVPPPERAFWGRFSHEAFPSHEEASPAGHLCTQDSPCSGARVLSSAARGLGAGCMQPGDRAIPPQSLPSPCRWPPLHLSLLSHQIRPLSRTNGTPTPPCATSQDPEMPARTWAPTLRVACRGKVAKGTGA